jgi:hypothetical protein
MLSISSCYAAQLCSCAVGLFCYLCELPFPHLLTTQEDVFQTVRRRTPVSCVFPVHTHTRENVVRMSQSLWVQNSHGAGVCQVGAFSSWYARGLMVY